MIPREILNLILLKTPAIPKETSMKTESSGNGQADGKPTRYDAVPYPSYTHPQTYPDRLAVIGTLFGLEPRPIEHCRVLELGCGDGGNLVSMASTLPQSEFLGLDLAAQPIARGQQMIREVGLTNVRLIQANIAEFENGADKFDYIIAHGIFSWVPPEVRERLLALCRNSLAPHGIAFISYNAFPGAHLRNMIREMMLYHVRAYESASDRLHQGLAFAKFLADSQDGQNKNHPWLKAELDAVLEHDSNYVYHDQLSDINQPFYFVQFMEKAAAHDLQYLGEADCFEMFTYGFNDSTLELLKPLASNRVLREQYADFVKCRRFRQTLLCHREAALQTDPLPEKVAGFFISSRAKRTAPADDLHPGVVVQYSTAKGAECATDYSLGKAALAVLAAGEWLRFEDLQFRAEGLLRAAGINPEPEGDQRKKFSGFLLELYGAGVLDFRTRLPTMVHTVSERPAVSALARWQVQHCQSATSQLHVAVKIEDEIGRCLLSALDGTLDRAALREKLWELLKSRNALVITDGDEAAVRRKIEGDLDQNLEKLARLGLLVS